MGDGKRITNLDTKYCTAMWRNIALPCKPPPPFPRANFRKSCTQIIVINFLAESDNFKKINVRVFAPLFWPTPSPPTNFRMSYPDPKLKNNQGPLSSTFHFKCSPLPQMLNRLQGEYMQGPSGYCSLRDIVHFGILFTSGRCAAAPLVAGGPRPHQPCEQKMNRKPCL